MISAAESFKFDRGTSFRTFAQYRVLGNIRERRRDTFFVGRNSTGKVPEQPKQEDIGDPVIANLLCDSDNLEENLNLKEVRVILLKLIENLSLAEKQVIIGVYFEDKNQNEMAEEMQFTEGRISQLKKDALKKLRKKLTKEILMISK